MAKQGGNKGKGLELTDDERDALKYLLSIVLQGARSPVRDQMTPAEFSKLSSIRYKLNR